MVAETTQPIGVGSRVRVWCPNHLYDKAWHNTVGTVVGIGYPTWLHWAGDNTYRPEQTYAIQTDTGDRRQFRPVFLFPVT